MPRLYRAVLSYMYYSWVIWLSWWLLLLQINFGTGYFPHFCSLSHSLSLCVSNFFPFFLFSLDLSLSLFEITELRPKSLFFLLLPFLFLLYSSIACADEIIVTLRPLNLHKMRGGGVIINQLSYSSTSLLPHARLDLLRLPQRLNWLS